MQFQIVYLIAVVAWIIVSIIGQVKSTAQNSWTQRVALGRSLTLSILFLMDQANTILFGHTLPGTLAFTIALVILLISLQFTIENSIALMVAKVLITTCFIAELACLALFLPQGRDSDNKNPR